MTHRQWLNGSLLCCAMILIATGCSDAVPTELQGKITLDNQPVENGDISLYATGADGAKAAGTITNGEYKIDAGSGLKPGDYKVVIHWLKPTGKKVPSADPGFTMDETREAIPRKYNENTQLTVKVEAGPNTKDFPLASK